MTKVEGCLTRCATVLIVHVHFEYPTHKFRTNFFEQDPFLLPRGIKEGMGRIRSFHG